MHDEDVCFSHGTLTIEKGVQIKGGGVKIFSTCSFSPPTIFSPLVLKQLEDF